MRFGLCVDGFNQFASFATFYSCWPIILMVYNLTPGMCMRLEFMFLSTIILGPSNPSRNIDVCLRLLIDELTQLWSSRALTYDISRKQNFVMREALMWTINDYPTYGIVFGWSMHGKLACTYCIENKGKGSFFDCRVISCQQITGAERIKRIFLLAELKNMLHPRILEMKNCMM